MGHGELLPTWGGRDAGEALGTEALVVRSPTDEVGFRVRLLPLGLIALIAAVLYVEWPGMSRWLRYRMLPGVTQRMWQQVSSRSYELPDPLYVRSHANQLKLTARQRVAVDRLVKQYRVQLAPHTRALDVVSQRLLSYRGQRAFPPISLSRLRRLQDDVETVMLRISAVRRQSWGKLEKVLTSSQRRQIRDQWAKDEGFST